MIQLFQKVTYYFGKAVLLYALCTSSVAHAFLECHWFFSSENTNHIKVKDFSFTEYNASKKFYKEQINELLKADSKHARKLQTPLAKESLIALIEVLANRQMISLDLMSRAPIEINKTNFKRIQSIVKSWKKKSSLTEEDLYEVLSAYYLSENYSYFNLKDWKILFAGGRSVLEPFLSRRFEVGLMVKSVASYLKMKTQPQNSIIRRTINYSLRAALWVLLPRLPQLAAMDNTKIQQGLESVSETIATNGVEHGYEEFKKLFAQRAGVNLNYKWFKKIANTAITAAYAAVVLYAVDAEVIPLQAVYKSREAVTNEIMQVVDSQYYAEYGRHLNSDELSFYRSGFDGVSKVQLILENRSYQEGN